MQCVIHANNLKVFGKAIHALARIGTELYIEDITTGLALRTVNSSKSAYASITFKLGFFHSYESGIDPEVDDEDEATKCKVDMKACLGIFKSLTVVEKTIERCTLNMQAYDTKLTIKLYCINDVVKTITLYCIESESLKTVFSKQDCRNHISVAPKLLRCAFNSFRSNQDEVTLNATRDLVILNNYVDNRMDAGTIKVLHTERRLDSEEFEMYEIQNETDITFSLKDLRAVLVFSDITDESVSIHFDAPGKPVVFVIQDQPAFEGNFVFATLDSEENQENRTSKSRNAANMTESHINIAEKSKFDSPLNSNSTSVEVRASTSSFVPSMERSVVQRKSSEDLEPMPKSPPDKRLRSMSPESAVPVYEVLASDTDDEY